ncbi:Hypothetical protein MAU_5040 [Metamycoplasma auris 15026]|uniref:DUF2779 domain-containing protein n=1 Tax=Metamycoplasma auris 15026 TaxID=1188233 RepID=N9VBE6_9BACT|nr:DUF2779 domain-containing protein [Metamycoplasma auris]ENY68706.1 Hypothetical protein MAU_5040 [Metamycoplasma auris 15026]
MKIKKDLYSFNDFLIANTTRPWFIFNDADDILLDENPNSFNAKLDESFDAENLLEEHFDLLDFKIEQIDEIFNTFIVKYLNKNEKEKLNSLSIYEKIEYLKEEIKSNSVLKKSIDTNDIKKNIEYLFELFQTLEMFSNGLDELEKQAISFLIDFYKEKENLDDSQIKFISNKQTSKNKISETIQALKDGYKLIINPLFEYQNCFTKVLFFDARNNFFGNLNYSNKTKKRNILKAYYDYSIIKNYFDINEIFILKPKYLKKKNQKKGKLEFLLTKYSSQSKSGYAISPEKRATLSEDEINALYVSDPNFAYSSSRIKTNNLSLLEHVKSEMVYANYNFIDKKIGNFESKNSIYTCSFKEFLYLIENNKNLETDWKVTIDDFIDNFGANKFFPKIFAKSYPNYQFGSKKILKAIAGIDLNLGSLKENLIKEFYDLNLIAINPKIEEIFEYKVINDMEKNIAWFDFEGVTLPYPIIDGVANWSQIISQTSIIKTKGNEIYESNDYVYDPLTFNLDTYKKIVDDLYDENISYYIIYNISYERSRLNEIKDSLFLYYKKNELSYEEYLVYVKKIDFIVERLVDLCNFFKGYGLKYFVHDRIINLGEINGASSIKKIEFFVTQNNLGKFLKHNIIPYAKLDVKNGAAALLIATTRALNVIRENEWNKKTIELKKYCHNDVMAMLMTADLIKYLMQNKDEYFNNWNKYDC